jgi:hypothetical protein
MIKKGGEYMGKKRTHKEYVCELSIKNSNIEVVEQYINNRTPILHRCKIDGYEWKVRPYCLLSGQGCPMCAGNAKRTHEQYIKDLTLINPSIEVVEKYINVDTAILHRCQVCNYEWSVKPNHTLSGHGCPRCAAKLNGESKRKDVEEYLKELLNVNQNIELVDDYINYNTAILHKCKKCNYEWPISPQHTLRGQGCPRCNESHGERWVRQWLEQHKASFIFQHRFKDCKDIFELPFDFYLPHQDVCIEYQGRQHYEPVNFGGINDEQALKNLETTQLHDQIKKGYCLSKNIQLLCIPYWEDVEKYLNKFLLI